MRSLGPFSSLETRIGDRPRIDQTIRARESDQADVLHRVGGVRHQQESSRGAVPPIGEAIAPRPGRSAILADRAEV